VRTWIIRLFFFRFAGSVHGHLEHLSVSHSLCIRAVTVQMAAESGQCWSINVGMDAPAMRVCVPEVLVEFGYLQPRDAGSDRGGNC